MEVENSKKLLCQFSVNLIGTSWHIVTQQLPVHLSHAMNNVILRGILVVIIATSGFLMVTTDSPYPLATLGLCNLLLFNSLFVHPTFCMQNSSWDWQYVARLSLLRAKNSMQVVKL